MFVLNGKYEYFQNNLLSAYMALYLRRGQTHPFVDGKYGADRGQAVDVAGAIQRVETDHVLSLWRYTNRPKKYRMTSEKYAHYKLVFSRYEFINLFVIIQHKAAHWN